MLIGLALRSLFLSSRSDAEELPTKHTKHTKTKQLRSELDSLTPSPDGGDRIAMFLSAKVFISCVSCISWAPPIELIRLRGNRKAGKSGQRGKSVSVPARPIFLFTCVERFGVPPLKSSPSCPSRRPAIPLYRRQTEPNRGKRGYAQTKADRSAERFLSVCLGVASCSKDWIGGVGQAPTPDRSARHAASDQGPDPFEQEIESS